MPLPAVTCQLHLDNQVVLLKISPVSQDCQGVNGKSLEDVCHTSRRAYLRNIYCFFSSLQARTMIFIPFEPFELRLEPPGPHRLFTSPEFLHTRRGALVSQALVIACVPDGNTKQCYSRATFHHSRGMMTDHLYKIVL